MTDRYGDAVRARRAELRAERSALGGAHRAEVRTAVALARITASDALADAVRELADEAHERVDSAGRAGRARLPAAVEEAVGELGPVVDAVLALEVRPALRRVAGCRGVDMAPGWPVLGAPAVARGAHVRPRSLRARTPLVAGAVEGMALWRAALVPLAVLPLLGLPAMGGPALAPLAVGIGVAGVVAAMRARRVAAARAALHRHVDTTLAGARLAVDTDVTRRLLALERAASADLDAALGRRRVAVDAELRTLSPAVAGG